MMTVVPARKTRPKAAPAPSELFLSIHPHLYRVHSLECDPGIAVKAFRLNKADGTLYDVAQTEHGPRCDCPDFIFRRDGLDPHGCLHIRAMRAVGILS